jgi:hypothetical protein
MLESKLCELFHVEAILLVRKLGEVTGIWDRYEHQSAVSVCAHLRTTMSKAARNRHNESIKGASSKKCSGGEEQQDKEKDPSLARKKHDAAANIEQGRGREHRVSVMAWVCHGGR